MEKSQSLNSLYNYNPTTGRRHCIIWFVLELLLLCFQTSKIVSAYCSAHLKRTMSNYLNFLNIFWLLNQNNWEVFFYIYIIACQMYYSCHCWKLPARLSLRMSWHAFELCCVDKPLGNTIQSFFNHGIFKIFYVRLGENNVFTYKGVCMCKGKTNIVSFLLYLSLNKVCRPAWRSERAFAEKKKPKSKIIFLFTFSLFGMFAIEFFMKVYALCFQQCYTPPQ